MYSFMTLFKSFRGLFLPWNFYAFTEHFLICSDGEYVVHGLSKIIQDYVNNKINN